MGIEVSCFNVYSPKNDVKDRLSYPYPSTVFQLHLSLRYSPTFGPMALKGR